MIRADRAGQFDLHGLRREERGVQSRVLPAKRLVPFVELVRQEDSLRLTVRAEGDRRASRREAWFRTLTSRRSPESTGSP